MSEVRASLAPNRGGVRLDHDSDTHARLTRQSLGRALSEPEIRLAEALEDIYKAGVGDFAIVAQQLTEQGVRAPASNETAWTVALLHKELAAINASLDSAYAAGSRSA